MRKCTRWAAAATLVLGVAAAGPSLAQAAGAPRFALVSGETVARGSDMVYGKFGWPGIEFGYQRGVNEKVDAGVLLDLIYGVEGTTNTQFGLVLGAPLRATVVRRDKISVQLQFTPGVTLYTTTPVVFGFNFPVGATLGIQVAPDVRIAAGADMVMKLAVTPTASFEFAPMFGAGVEYYIDPTLSLSLDTRFGPVITSTSGAPTEFGFRTQVGLAYRLN
jgi:hypothetical protein